MEKCHGKRDIHSEHELDRILRKLIGDYMRPIYTRSVKGLIGRLKICCQCPQTTRVGDNNICVDLNEIEIPDPEETQRETRELVFRDLFLWSILTNRIEMSKVILSHMETRICSALIASKVFKSYLRFAFDNESKDFLQSKADEFEEYANECLKSCYNYDEEKACEIAIRNINLFGGVSCLQVKKIKFS